MATGSTYERAMEEMGYLYAWEHQEFFDILDAENDFQQLYEWFSREYMTNQEWVSAVRRGVARAWAEMKKKA